MATMFGCLFGDAVPFHGGPASHSVTGKQAVSESAVAVIDGVPHHASFGHVVVCECIRNMRSQVSPGHLSLSRGIAGRSPGGYHRG